jgi:hypothetical protein
MSKITSTVPEVVTGPEAPEIIIDRGQPVIATVVFGDDEPDYVYFSYVPPGAAHARVDEGYGTPSSMIHKLAEKTYRCAFDTDEFEPGKGTWCFWGVWKSATRKRPYTKSSIKGKYTVREVPAYLL